MAPGIPAMWHIRRRSYRELQRRLRVVPSYKELLLEHFTREMALVKKLQIQGIRSYNPYEPVTVEFYKPLTIIVGHNGSGKTV